MYSHLCNDPARAIPKVSQNYQVDFTEKLEVLLVYINIQHNEYFILDGIIY